MALKSRESQLNDEIESDKKSLEKKKQTLSSKQEQYRDVENQIKAEEDRKYDKQKELDSILNIMQDEADQMSFQEFAFMKEELCQDMEKSFHRLTKSLKNITQSVKNVIFLWVATGTVTQKQKLKQKKKRRCF